MIKWFPKGQNLNKGERLYYTRNMIVSYTTCKKKKKKKKNQTQKKRNISPNYKIKIVTDWYIIWKKLLYSLVLL